MCAKAYVTTVVLINNTIYIHMYISYYNVHTLLPYTILIKISYI